MRKSSRIVVIVLGGIAAGLVLVALVGYFAFRYFSKDIRAVGLAIEKEAAAFAQGHTVEDCVAEALARQTREATFMGGVRAKVFLRQCLGKVPPVQGFCEGVPPYGEILATVRWTTGACERHGKPNDEVCSRTMQAVIEFCSGK